MAVLEPTALAVLQCLHNTLEACQRMNQRHDLPTHPHRSPLTLSSVWECASPQQADDLLAGRAPGFVYRRDGNPNAQELASACAALHGVEEGITTSSGMAAIAAGVLACVQAGEHVLLSDRLYGKTTAFVTNELQRLGIASAQVDMRDLGQTRAAMRENTRLLIVETIANPCLEVFDLRALAEIAHLASAKLLVDNTFATPYVCRPAEHRADYVMESLTKMMNGHSDVILGFLGGAGQGWERVPAVVSTWGMCSSPMDCWLALRGLGTLDLRMQRACENAASVATYLEGQGRVGRVDYPGLASHPQHALARQQFGDRFGSLLTLHLTGGRPAADAFIASAKRIPFCPSLGELTTTLSHPETTSHRGLSMAQRESLGITGGTIRLSVGVEPISEILAALEEGLAGNGAA